MKVNSKISLDFLIPPEGKIHLCDAEIKDAPAGWRVSRGYGNTCQRHAIYILNGAELCRMHAGARLLDLLMKDHPSHFYSISNQPSLRRKP